MVYATSRAWWWTFTLRATCPLYKYMLATLGKAFSVTGAVQVARILGATAGKA